jgi:hypothetical protein
MPDSAYGEFSSVREEQTGDRYLLYAGRVICTLEWKGHDVDPALLLVPWLNENRSALMLALRQEALDYGKSWHELR